MTDEPKDRNTRPFSDYEKERVRANVHEFMREHPLRAPFFIRTLDAFERWAYNPRLQFASGALALALVAGTGTAFAAQSALPGDPLYGVKVDIEEPVMGAFATSAQAQANWNAQLAQRRLSEAEQLAAQNKLTQSDATTIAGGLNQATENFDASVAQLATSSQNAATVAALASNMEATLAANTQVMSEIETAVPSAAPTLAPILSSVQERADSLENASTQLDAAAAQTNVAQVKVAAQAELDAAQSQVENIPLNARSVATSTPAAVQAQEAEAEIQSGQQSLAQGNYTAALETLQAATVEAQAAQLNASIGQQLGNAAGIELPNATSSSAFSAAVGQNEATSSQATSTQSNATSTQPAEPMRHHHDHGSQSGQPLPSTSIHI